MVSTKGLQRKGYLRAADLTNRPDGSYVKVAGLAIVKQHPGTASGVVFLSLWLMNPGCSMSSLRARFLKTSAGDH
jgi:hypothetical protein